MNGRLTTTMNFGGATSMTNLVFGILDVTMIGFELSCVYCTCKMLMKVGFYRGCAVRLRLLTLDISLTMS